MHPIEQEKFIKFIPRFGKVAVDMGYITADQLKEGLNEQIDNELSSKQHRPIGMILHEKNYMSRAQIIEVLNHLI